MSEHILLPEGSIEKQTTTLNLGPTHPATHGVFQNIVELDGERIVSAEQTVGYIHRAFEKLAERRPLFQITTLTDRLNYCSSPINNMGWHITCEKLLGVKTPKRVDYLRIIIMERTIGAGPISAERALNYGFTGPNLRAAGVDYDVRVHTPYSSYEDFEFEIPVGKTGDCYDRFLVRNQEMWQSLRIIGQAYEKVKAFTGAEAEVFHADEPDCYLP